MIRQFGVVLERNLIMSNQVVSHIGSGRQQFRQDFHGKHHQAADTVFIVNWEDDLPVHAVFTSGFTVHTAAVLLPPSGALGGRRILEVFNNNTSGTLFVGPTGVTTLNGYPIPTGTSKVFNISALINLYAIGAASGIDCRTIEIA